MKIIALILIACGFACPGCTRAVELHHSTLPHGGSYTLAHKSSRVPFSDAGTLFLIVDPGQNEEASLRLLGGYDLYTDLRLSVAMADGVLFVHDERSKNTWAVDLTRKMMIDREPTGLVFVEVGQPFRR